MQATTSAADIARPRARLTVEGRRVTDMEARCKSPVSIRMEADEEELVAHGDTGWGSPREAEVGADGGGGSGEREPRAMNRESLSSRRPRWTAWREAGEARWTGRRERDFTWAEESRAGTRVAAFTRAKVEPLAGRFIAC